MYCFLCLNIIHMLTLYCTHLLTYQTMFSMHIEIMAVLFLTVSLQPVTGWHKIMDTQYWFFFYLMKGNQNFDEYYRIIGRYLEHCSIASQT